MGTKVMFTALAEHDGDYGPFDEDKMLLFNKEITNVGEAYDSASGFFTAYTSGYYYFTLFHHATQGHKSGLSLMRNSEVVFNTFDDTGNEPEFSDNAGNSALLYLERGNKVFVRLPAKFHIYASDRATSFSGLLVSEM